MLPPREKDFFFPADYFVGYLTGPQAASQTANMDHRNSQKVWPMAPEAHGLNRQSALRRELASILNNF